MTLAAIDIGTPTPRPKGGYPKGTRRGGRAAKYTWTPALERILLDRYDGLTSTLDEMMASTFDALGFPRWEVRKRAKALGLARVKESPWSPESEAWLAEHLSTTSWKELAAHLKRSQCAVKLKAKRLEVSKGTRGQDGTFTGRGAAQICGVDDHKVTGWVEAGRLPATGRGVERPQGDILRILPADLRRFILAHPEEIDLRRIEGAHKVEFLQLVAGDTAEALPASPPAPSSPVPGRLVLMQDQVDVLTGLHDALGELLGRPAQPVLVDRPRAAPVAAPAPTPKPTCPVLAAAPKAPSPGKPRPARAPKLPAPPPPARQCIGHAGHECVVEVPRKGARCRACKKAHKAEYMAAYWKRPDVIAKYGVNRTAAVPPPPVPATTATRAPTTATGAAKRPGPPAAARSCDDGNSCTNDRDGERKAPAPSRQAAARPPAPAPALAPKSATTPASASKPIAAPKPAAVAPPPKPKAPVLSAAEKAARFAEAHSAPEKPVVEKARPTRPPVPEDGLTMGDIHRRTGLPFSILKGRVEQGLLKVVNPDERPPRYTPQSVEDLERCFKTKRRAEC